MAKSDRRSPEREENAIENFKRDTYDNINGYVVDDGGVLEILPVLSSISWDKNPLAKWLYLLVPLSTLS